MGMCESIMHSHFYFEGRKTMDNTVMQSGILEKNGVFDEDTKRRYELTTEYRGIEGKSILVFGINPASDNIQISDTTTNYLLNNLLVMGYSKITVCNLFANICTKLRPSQVTDNEDNFQYISEVLKRDYDTILIGYGNTFTGNKSVEQEKVKLHTLLKTQKGKAVEIVDVEGKYTKLRAIHPLFAGQRFSGQWKLRAYEFPKLQRKNQKENG